MCGLAGYVGPTAPVDRARLAAMGATLAHRGPDGEGLWTAAADDVAVGLAHRRLAIVDGSPAGAQPMHRGGLSLVFNGEIYGHDALRAGLRAAWPHFEGRSDTEIIPALYAERGLDLLADLDGMFAFALYDPTARRLLLARDRLGIKPLFYAQRPDGGLLFASEIKALLAAGVVDTAIDHQALHDYLGLTYVPGPRTLYRGIRQLPPGHGLEWRAGRVRIWRYWRARLASAVAEPGPIPSLRAAADVLRPALVEAVSARLMADVPLGVFLSGGVDSAAILWALREVGARRPAFTVRFEDADYDESVQAAATARALGAEHHVETVRPDPAAIVDALTPMMDQPFADSSAIPLWSLCRVARKQVTVALGGDGGDELFAGYRTHFAWALGKAWRRLPTPLRALAPRLVDRLPVSHGKVSFDLKARAFVAAAERPAVEAHYRFKQFMAEDLRRSLVPAASEIEPTLRLFEAAAAAPGAGTGLDALLACDRAIYLPDDILVKADRVGMLHGLEIRVPLLDHRLVERVDRWPAGHKLRWPVTKVVLKAALAGRVPAGVLTRRKAGFNVPMARWLNGPLAPLVHDLLDPAAIRADGLLDPRPVRRLIAEHRGRHADHSRPLWTLLCLMLSRRALRRRWTAAR